jgi:Uncharacterized protein conserved in bacteria
MHYYKFNIKDWTRDTAHLSIEEEGVYRRLIDHYYESEMPIPQETQWVIRRLRLATHEQALSVVLNEFFFLSDDGYHHARCDKEIKGYHGKAGANRENGKLGGRPKKPTDNPDGFENEPTNNLNHKPLTTNQEPLTNKQEKTSVAAKAARVKFDPLPMKPANVSEQVWAEWCQARSESRKPLTKAMCTAQAKQLDGHGNADEVIRKSIAAGWQGLFPDSVKSASARHSGFDQIDYMDGLTVDENGSLRF